MPRADTEMAPLVPAIVEAEPSTVRILTLLSPIPGRDGRLRLAERIADAGRPLTDYLPRQRCVASINGGVVPPDQYTTRIIRENEEIVIKPELQGAFFLIGLGIALVGAALSFGVGLLFPPKIPKFHEPDDPTYSFSGIRSTRGPGAKVPVVYGQHRIGLQQLRAFIQPLIHNRISSMGQSLVVAAAEQPPTVNILGSIGEGEIEEIITTTALLNGQPVSNFDNSETFTRLGTSGQSAISVFSETKNSFAPGGSGEIDSDGLIYTTTDDISAFEFLIDFKDGLASHSNTRGELESNWTRFQFRHRVSPAGAWSSATVVRINGRKTSIVHYALRLDGLALDTYDIEFKWLESRDDSDITGRYKPYLVSVTEIQAGTEAYPNTALLGFRALATDQLNGDIGNINLTVEVKGQKVRIGSFAATPTWTQNPAWCIMDFLTNTRYGLGIPDSEINLSAFQTYADYCDDTIPEFSNEVRHQLDYVLTADGEQAVLEMLRASRTELLKINGKWTPRPTRNDPPIQLLSWTNCTNVKIDYTRDRDRINVQEARFADRDRDYEQNVITWPIEDDWPAQVRKTTLDLRGVTRKTEVQRQLQFENNRRQLPKVTLTADCSPEALVLTSHDIFRFAHALPGWGYSGRIQAGSTTTEMVLDENVVIVGGNSYHLYVRHDDNTVEVKDVVNPGSTTTKNITLTSALSKTPVALKTTWAFGESSPIETAFRPFRMVKMRRLQNNMIQITAEEHNSNIYTEPNPVPIPDITILPNPLGQPPPLTNLVLTELPRIQLDGSSLSMVNASWDVSPLTEDYAPYGGAVIFRRESTAGAVGGQGILGEVLLGEGDSGTGIQGNYFRIATVGFGVTEFNDIWIITGTTYQYKIVPISIFGVQNVNGFVTGSITVLGPTEGSYIPGAVQNLRLRGKTPAESEFEGVDIHMEWDPISSSDLFTDTFFIRDYIIEIWNPSQSVLYRTACTADTQFVYSYQMNEEDQIAAGNSSARRDLLFVVRPRTNVGREGPSATKSVSNPAPDMSGITPTLTPARDAILVDWGPFNEPRDLVKYDVLYGTDPSSLSVFESPPRYHQKSLISGLSAGSYTIRVLPFDAFGAGTQSLTNSASPLSGVSEAQVGTGTNSTIDSAEDSICSVTVAAGGSPIVIWAYADQWNDAPDFIRIRKGSIGGTLLHQTSIADSDVWALALGIDTSPGTGNVTYLLTGVYGAGSTPVTGKIIAR